MGRLRRACGGAAPAPWVLKAVLRCEVRWVHRGWGQEGDVCSGGGGIMVCACLPIDGFADVRRGCVLRTLRKENRQRRRGA